jgi:hypothetical protein
MSEHKIQNDIRNALARPECRTFRANTGQAWTGNKVERATGKRTVELMPGDVVIRQARPFSTGLPKGFPDLVGGVQHTVTEADIGKTLALLVFVENKSETGRLSREQEQFIQAMLAFGARAGVARSVEDAERIVFGVRDEQG